MAEKSINYDERQCSFLACTPSSIRLLPDADALFSAAEELASAGCTLLQYATNPATPQMLEDARELKARLAQHQTHHERPR